VHLVVWQRFLQPSPFLICKITPRISEVLTSGIQSARLKKFGKVAELLPARPEFHSAVLITRKRVTAAYFLWPAESLCGCEWADRITLALK